MRVFQIEGEWGIDNLKLSQRPEPEPGPGQVLVRMKASSLNYRDLVVPERGYGSYTGTLPLIPVSDGVGIVSAIGTGVHRVAVGDRVCPTYFQNWTGGEPENFVLAAIVDVSDPGLVILPTHRIIRPSGRPPKIWT